MILDRYMPPPGALAWDCVVPPGREGVRVVPAGEALCEAPDRERFWALDRIHMTEPYHRLMAQLWLGALVAK